MTMPSVRPGYPRWTLFNTEEPITRTFGSELTTHTRGWLLEGSLAHDVYHCAELNEILSKNRLPQVDLWG